MFYTGLFLGLAITSSIGFGVVLASLWSGKPIGGGLALAANVQPSAPSPAANNGDTQPSQPSAPVKPVKAVDERSEHILGNKNAKVTLVVYSDYQCPFCKRFEPTLQETIKKYPKDVRIVFRNFPLNSIHPYAQKAAEAAECVAKFGGNNAFWKMHDKIFDAAGKGDLTIEVLLAAAKESGVDQNRVKACIDSNEMKARVDADLASGSDAGVEGTPATFVNGKLVSGALPFSAFEAELKTAGAAQ